MSRDTYIAIEKLLDGKEVKTSTSIAGTPTHGFGELDFNGFWEFQIPENIYHKWRILDKKVFQETGKHLREFLV